ncbi:hypothetical protein GTA08_BOTSDO10036 [Botryosphaeria dothidea]|uniref:Uncharacterized protein n=1 Tax=Botryosphaeria dothidea TaxID=55169 RepID=A0A8H4IJR6_9PEZI|nr:hypothetical protein GTA08_BOTSDO10036 [Botryosphaeria dothidea]
MTKRWGTSGADNISHASADDRLYMHFLGQTQGADALHVHHMDRLSKSNGHTKGSEDGGPRPPQLETIDLSEWPKHTPAEDSPAPDHSFLYPPSPTPYLTSTRENYDPSEVGDENPLRSRRYSQSRRYSRRIEESSRFGLWTLILLLLAVVMVILTALYSTGSAKSLMKGKIFTTSSSNSILVLRILTELCAVILGALVIVVVEDLQWALASRPGGVSLLHFVGLDSGTGVWGLVRLLATADWRQKYSSAFRLMIILSIPLPGIILMGDINIELVFFPEHTYPVAAGLSNFNASYINELTAVSTTALLVQMGNPVWSDREVQSLEPLGPKHGRCTVSKESSKWVPCDESYFMAGGFNSVSPQADDLVNYPDSTAYVVPNVKGYHVEYGKVHDLKTLHDEGNCHLIGSASAAAYWCAATGSDQELLFGSAYCPLSLQQDSSCLNSTSWTDELELSTSLFVYRRFATINYSRANFSILSITDLSEPKQYPIDLQEYMLALSAVVPGFNSSSDVKGDNSALAIYAVTALPISDSEVAKKLSLKAIRKAMSVPFDYFQANYFAPGPPIWELKTPREGLAEDMYTNMSISIMSYQVVAGQVSRWLFLAFACTLLLLCTATIIVTVRICERRPQRCGYPSLDFAAVCAHDSMLQENHHGNGLHRSLTRLKEQPGKFEVARRIKDERIVLR